MEVRDLEGQTWVVRRRWLPGYADAARRRWTWSRIGNRASHSLELADIGDGGIAGLLFVVGAVLVLALVFAVVPLVVDVVVIVLAVLLGSLVREGLRRPWTVEAVCGDLRFTRPVVGWRAAGRAADTWADELRHGRGVLPPAGPG